MFRPDRFPVVSLETFTQNGAEMISILTLGTFGYRIGRLLHLIFPSFLGCWIAMMPDLRSFSRFNPPFFLYLLVGYYVAIYEFHDLSRL